MQTRERVWENLKVYVTPSRTRGFTIHKYFQILPNPLSSVCIRLYKHRASVFCFFYKIRLGNMLWRHNRVCIAWYKHGNWPITACVRHNLFYNIIYYTYIWNDYERQTVYYSSLIANSEKCLWTADGDWTRNLLISGETLYACIIIPILWYYWWCGISGEYIACIIIHIT